MVTAHCQKREQCLREVTSQDTVEYMCWAMSLIDHLVEVKASRLLPYNIPMPHTDDSMSNSYKLHNKLFVWPRSTKHLESQELESLGVAAPLLPHCSMRLQSLNVQLGPGESRGVNSSSTFCFISPCQQGFKLASISHASTAL